MTKIVFKYLGKVMMMYSILLLIPAFVALIYNEALLVFVFPSIISFIVSASNVSFFKDVKYFEKPGTSEIISDFILLLKRNLKLR